MKFLTLSQFSLATVILPKLWICYRGDGNVSLTFNNRAGTQQSRAGGPGQISGTYISGLGDVSHIDRDRLTSTKRSTNEDIASDDFNDNEEAKEGIDSGNANGSGVDPPRVKKRVSFPDDGSASGE